MDERRSERPAPALHFREHGAACRAHPFTHTHTTTQSTYYYGGRPQPVRPEAARPVRGGGEEEWREKSLFSSKRPSGRLAVASMPASCPTHPRRSTLLHSAGWAMRDPSKHAVKTKPRSTGARTGLLQGDCTRRQPILSFR